MEKVPGIGIKHACVAHQDGSSLARVRHPPGIRIENARNLLRSSVVQEDFAPGILVLHAEYDVRFLDAHETREIAMGSVSRCLRYIAFVLPKE